MKRLIIHGDPGIRKGGIIEYDGEQMHCFGVARQGDYHGPDRVQLWCTIGTEDELEAFERREFIPMHLDVDAVDASEIVVVKAKGDLAV
ncbi:MULTISPECIES: HAH_0734 family protein [unclassified Haladaptatus]|uniref:HAH_0734 family protein n=1 Tax=unclassified Haladaptatus TaxID=2622732 RepID=UPI002FCE23AE